MTSIDRSLMGWLTLSPTSQHLQSLSNWNNNNNNNNNSTGSSSSSSTRDTREKPRRPRFTLEVPTTLRFLNTEADTRLGDCRVLKVGHLGFDDLDDDYDDDNEDVIDHGIHDTESDYSDTSSNGSGYSSDESIGENEGRNSRSSTCDATHCMSSGSHHYCNKSGQVGAHQILHRTRHRNYIYEPKMLNNKDHIPRWIELMDFRDLRIKQISGGGYHVCALTDDGVVVSMGWNRYGQLGTGDTNNRNTLSLVKWDTYPAPKIEQVKCSGRHTLLVATDGRLYSMGCGENGRLGLGNTENRNTPQLVRALEGMRVKIVATAFWHSIVSTECNRTFVFGHGEEGKLGLGAIGDVMTPREVMELRGREIVSASGGAWHTIIATKDRHVYTAGSNYWGQLGIPLKQTRSGDTRDRSDRLIEVEALRGLHVIKASAGSNFNIVLTANNELYAFGCGSSGKCGLNTKDTVRIPRRIQFNHPVKDICNGSNHSTILTAQGQVYSFGWNKYYQLGNGSESETFVPKRVKALEGVHVTMIASGAFFTLCATRQLHTHNPGFSCMRSPPAFTDMDVVCL